MKNDQEKFNPCLKEQTITYKCLDNNSYKKEKCEMQINNYNICKAFWNHIRLQRKREGITPNVPEPEEREKIKADYFEQFMKSS